MTSVTLCTRCVIDSTVPGSSFGRDGVCNYCRLHDILDRESPRGQDGEKILDDLVARIKQNGRGKNYDCVVGVSGGTDSIYLLYLTKRLGLRPLAVHFDNGWDSEIAVNNIQKALTTLQIDLQTYVVDWEEFKDILRSFLKASIPWADIPTDIGIVSALYRVANQEHLRYILVGNNFRTEGKMPTEWTYADGRMLKAIHHRFGQRKIKTFPNLTLFDMAYYSLVWRIRILRPLNYVDYRKDKARDILSKEMDWQYYGGHHYESIYTRFAYSFLLPRKFHIDKRIITHSALVRSGEMTREAALESLAQAAYPPDQAQQDVSYVIKKLDLSEAEFAEIMAQPPKSFRDYPSYYPWFERLAPLVRLASRVLLRWTPPMFHQLDASSASEQNA